LVLFFSKFFENFFMDTFLHFFENFFQQIADFKIAQFISNLLCSFCYFFASDG